MHGEMRLVHGYPMGKDEVATNVNFFPYPLGFGPLGREWWGKKNFFGLFAPKPNISVN